MYCDFCGTKAGLAGFCTNCGKSLDAAAKPVPVTQTATHPMPSAQVMPQPDDIYVEPPPASTRPSRRDPRTKPRTGFILGIIGATIALVAVALAALFWLFGSDTPSGDREPSSQSESDTYGSNDDLDALWDECALGDYEACDTLYISSPAGSEYEDFGASCGGRADAPGICSLVDSSNPVSPEGSYGSDPLLDFLWIECEAGDFASCDDLYLESPPGSEYEEFGVTCGGRSAADGDCVVRFDS